MFLEDLLIPRKPFLPRMTIYFATFLSSLILQREKKPSVRASHTAASEEARFLSALLLIPLELPVSPTPPHPNPIPATAGAVTLLTVKDLPSRKPPEAKTQQKQTPTKCGVA